MTTLHPHWHATEDDAQPVNIRVASVQTQQATVSRRPAAIMGIAIVLGLGFFAFQGISSLRGQLTDTGVVIRITSDGLVPPSAIVFPGQTITWSNETTVPQILASDTLKTADGTSMQTSPIFPNATQAFTVPNAAVAGNYPYASRTSPTIAGSITVSVPASSASSTAVSASSLSSLPTQGFVPYPTAPTLPTAPVAATVENLIPQNPFTVGSTANQPTPPAGGRMPPAMQQNTTLRPTRQPATGPGLWIVSGLSIGALWLVTRKQLRTLRMP